MSRVYTNYDNVPQCLFCIHDASMGGATCHVVRHFLSSDRPIELSRTRSEHRIMDFETLRNPGKKDILGGVRV